MDRTDKFLRALIALAWLLASAALWWPTPAHAARIKEVAVVQGVRSNPLVGYGLVVGLDGTGDQTTSAPFTTQSITALLQQMGVTVPPGTNMQLKNVAAVMVTAQLPAFAQPGQTLDGRVVRVRMPATPDARVTFMADIENLNVELASPAAKVVINARTGSVVMNQAVTLAACAVAHGSLSVTISSTPVISQPSPFAKHGDTVVSEKADITIAQQAGSLIQMPAGTKLADVVKALNSLGATPQDLLAILQAMKSAGALNAELEVI